MTEENIVNNSEEQTPSVAPRKAIKKKVIVRAKSKGENKEVKDDVDLSSYGLRRQARIYSVMALYSYDINSNSVDDLLALSYGDGKNINDSVKEFAKELTEGTIKNCERIDSIIEKYSKNWNIERIKFVDKAIIRMSIYSLIYLKNIPKSVVIDEAVEISKIFGDKDSYRFVNGILDGIQENDIQ